MGIKEFFNDLFSTEKEEIISALSIERYKNIRKINELSKEIEALKDIIKSFENKPGYYVGFTDDGLESNHIVADKLGFYDDKYVFYRDGKVVGLFNPETYKEVIFVESEKEN